MKGNEKNGTNLFLLLSNNVDREVVLKAILTTTLLHFKESLGPDLTKNRLSVSDCPDTMETLKAYRTDRHLKFFVDALCATIMQWHKLFFELKTIGADQIKN